MKKTVYTLLAVIFLFGSVACSKSDKKSSIRARGTRGEVSQPGYNGNNQAYSQSQYGEIVSNGNDLESSLVSFLSTESNAAEYLGTVSGYSNGSTGVRFLGTASGNNNGTLSQGSLQIGIWDSYAVETDQSEIVLNFDFASGTVNDYSATITYDDGVGALTLNGQFVGNNGDTFEGTISYQNRQGFDGQARSGTLGRFRVPTCGFFKCVN